MKPKYFWLLKDGSIRELDLEKYRKLVKRNWKGANFLLCVLMTSEIHFQKGDSMLNVPLNQLKKILGEVEK